MLDNLAVLDAEDVDSSLAAICIIEGNVVVDEDEVAIRADVLDFRLALREFLEEALNAILECLTAILEADCAGCSPERSSCRSRTCCAC